MGKLSIWIHAGTAAVLALAGSTDSRAQPVAGAPAHPDGAVIMFGANWCAPCLAELRDLPALAAAAAPARLILAWRDGAPPALWPAWPANAEMKNNAEAERMAGASDLSAGLPYAVLIDGAGRRCAVWNGKLTRDRIARLRARCTPDR